MLHVLGLQRSLISVRSITKNGGSVHFSSEKCEISTQEGFVAVGHKKGNIYFLDFEENSFHATATSAISTGT